MSPLSQCLGMELHTLEQGSATVRLSAREAVRNSFGVAHGGALMSVMDVAMALAARSFDMRQGVVTIEMKSSFMRAADLAHGHLQAIGKVLHRTPTLAFCEVSVWDGKGQCCAHGTGTFKILTRLASGHRTVHGLMNAAD
ncbi:PaaI family thioesterase [Curvibacter sp. CHRR-16]|nr:PaaI family thioesterase [Curvibacter sp. CHRR-16]